jgi:hypothetical protein
VEVVFLLLKTNSPARSIDVAGGPRADVGTGPVHPQISVMLNDARRGRGRPLNPRCFPAVRRREAVNVAPHCQRMRAPDPLRSLALPLPRRRLCGSSRHSSLRVGRQIIGRSAHPDQRKQTPHGRWQLAVGGAAPDSAFRNKACVAEQPLINVVVESRAQFRGG